MKYVPPPSGTRPMLMKAGTKVGAVGGNPQVARASERESGAGCGSVDGGDHGLLERADREHGGVVVRAQPLGDVVGAFAELGQVLADAEPAPCAREDNGSDIVGAGFLERAHELFLRRARQRVEHLRPVERDRQDPAFTPGLDLCHRSRLLTPCGRTGSILAHFGAPLVRLSSIRSPPEAERVRAPGGWGLSA